MKNILSAPLLSLLLLASSFTLAMEMPATQQEQQAAKTITVISPSGNVKATLTKTKDYGELKLYNTHTGNLIVDLGAFSDENIASIRFIDDFTLEYLDENGQKSRFTQDILLNTNYKPLVGQEAQDRRALRHLSGAEYEAIIQSKLSPTKFSIPV